MAEGRHVFMPRQRLSKPLHPGAVGTALAVWWQDTVME